MTTWQSPASRPLSIHNLVLGVAIGLAILCAAITLFVVVERPRDELGSAIDRLDAARGELLSSTQAMREATSALQAATRAPATINIMDLPPATPQAPAAGAWALPGANLTPEPPRYCPEPGRCVLPRATLEQMLANPTDFIDQARIMPSVRDGVTRGFKVYGLRPGSLLKDLGLKNGDLLRSVNGLPLNGMDQAMATFAKLRRSDDLTLEIERKGETLRQQISIQ